jgi:hypothetical protein
MAIYRQIQTSFWQDDFVLQLTPEEKYFYLYLLTNSKTKQCGIYQLPMQVIIMETGYNQETAEKLLRRFVDYGKVIYNSKTREIGLVNWPKYNPMESPKIRACVERELKEVKDKTLIPVIYPDRYPIQGVSQEEKEEEKEKAEAEEEEKEKPRQTGDPMNKPEPMELCSDAQPDYNGTSIQMQAELLFIRSWNKQKPNPEEIRIAADYIMKFGYSEVETAFTEAVKYDRKKLAYVETVCKKRKERADLKKKTELERQKRLEQEKKLEEERKSGKGLGLIEKVFGDGGMELKYSTE